MHSIRAAIPIWQDSWLSRLGHSGNGSKWSAIRLLDLRPNVGSVVLSHPKFWVVSQQQNQMFGRLADTMPWLPPAVRPLPAFGTKGMAPWAGMAQGLRWDVAWCPQPTKNLVLAHTSHTIDYYRIYRGFYDELLELSNIAKWHIKVIKIAEEEEVHMSHQNFMDSKFLHGVSWRHMESYGNTVRRKWWPSISGPSWCWHWGHLWWPPGAGHWLGMIWTPATISWYIYIYIYLYLYL